MEIKFYFCDHCKNVAIKVVDHKVPLFCCGEKMTELVPGTVDAAVEKHLPEYTVKNGIVSVALCEGETVEAVYAYCNLHGLWEA